MITYYNPGGRYTPRLLVHNEKRIETMALLGKVPGVSQDDGIVSMPAEPRLYEILVEKLGITPDDFSKEWYEEQIESERTLAETISKQVQINHPKEKMLRPYQRVGVQYIKSVSRCILGDEMGLGKSVETILATDISPRHKNILIVCPNSVKWQWAKEIATWSKYSLPVVVSEPKKAKKQLQEYREGWFILNYHNLRTYDLPRIQWDWIIYDEAHMMSNRKTKTVAKAKNLAAANVVMLTGTPIGNNTADLWSLLNILYPKKFTSYWRFFEMYVDYVEDYFGSRKIIGTRNEEYLRRELAPVMLRRTKQDVSIDIPDKTVINIEVEMTIKQAKYYKDMALNAIAQAETGEEVQAFAEIAIITRLRQILSTPHTIGFDDSSGKLDAAMDIITGTDQQIVVFSLYKGTIAALEQRLKKENISCGIITGDVEAEDREEAKDSLDSGDSKVLLCTLGAGGTGLNLQAASVAIFIEHHWNPREQHQAEGRLHRIGQKNPVTIYNLICKESIDAAVEDVIARKQMISDAILKEALVQELSRYKKNITEKLMALYKI